MINILQVTSGDFLVTTIPWAPMKPGMTVQIECPGNLSHLRIILESIEKGKQHRELFPKSIVHSCFQRQFLEQCT